VWADSAGAVFNSTTNDQFAIQATNGVWIAQDLGAQRTANVGERFRDNGIIAWARITSAGLFIDSFNVTNVVSSGTGAYRVYIGANAGAGNTLVPMAVAEVDSQPTAAADVRIVSVNQIGLNYFDVWINNGLFAAVDNDFLFMVTGR